MESLNTATNFSYTGKVVVNIGLFQIENCAALHEYLETNPDRQAQKLFEELQKEHKRSFARNANLRKNSFVTELFGHLIAAHYLLKFPKSLKALLTKSFYKRATRSCEEVDCGEKEKDPNRWFWDLFAFMHLILARWYRLLQARSKQAIKF